MAKRIRESELIHPALEIAAKSPRGEVETKVLITELTNRFKPKGTDAEILDGRSDTYFSQKVRNLVSHRKQPSSMFAKGLAEYTGDGIRITEQGLDYIKGS